MDHPNETDQLILLALVRLGDDAYGVTIGREIEERTGRSLALATVYATLDRLEARTFVESWISEPRPERGGRSRKHFRITPLGATALREAQAAMARMWQGLEVHPDLRKS
jgi:DNA-binding PadR family transcriptional regulator